MLFSCVLFSSVIFSQTPSSCFEIESVLVDGCDGSNEANNEMVRFKIGNTALNTSNLNVKWPNTFNGYLGICQNATTANNVAILNSTIQACGYILEPTGGVLPAGAQVILVTGESFNPAAQSFAGLNDTIYIIFQCDGNTGGHFANYSASGGIRTLIMSFSPPAACADTVSYDRGLLIMQNGTPGAQDGATVNFSWTGTPSYVNTGCTAPYVPIAVSIIQVGSAPDSAKVCNGGNITLAATATGNYNFISWSGGTGSFSPSNALTTTYNSSVSDSGTITLTVKTGNACDTVFAIANVQIMYKPIVTVNVSGATTFCQGDSVQLNASGGNSYQWSTGETTAVIIVKNSGKYITTVTNSCGNDTMSVTVTVQPTPVASVSAAGSTTICQGDSLQLNASGGTGYLWSNGMSTSSIYVNTQNNYTVTVSNNCGTDTAQIQVNVIAAPVASISISGAANICKGDSVLLTAGGNGSYLWTDGTNGQSIYASSGGTYTVTVTNSCGSDTASQIITMDSIPSVAVSASGPNVFCNGDSVVLTATVFGNGNLQWSDNSTQSSITVNTTGTYTVSVSNNCGSDSDSINIEVLSSPSAQINTNGPSAICKPSDVVTLLASGGSSYEWSTGETTQSIIISSAGNYYLTATNNCGTDTAGIVISTGSIDASFTLSDTVGFNPMQVFFSSTTANAEYYYWNFGNGTSSAEDIVSAYYNEPGDYLVTLIVTDLNGCSDTAYAQIRVEDIPLYIPSAFTPNGDNLNDVFYIYTANTKRFICNIYNRWGEKIISLDVPEKGWNGKTNDNILAESGIYVYAIDITFENKMRVQKTGKITLVR
jgi:gliding motility-associated-like protein